MLGEEKGRDTLNIGRKTSARDVVHLRNREDLGMRVHRTWGTEIVSPHCSTSWAPTVPSYCVYFLAVFS